MKKPIRLKRWSAVLALPLLLAGALGAADLTGLLKELFPVPSTTGNEDQLARKIRAALPAGLSVEEDDLGGFAVRFGRGAPRLVVLVPLDGYGFFVSGITPDGYLTLDRAVPPPHARFDGYLLGQPVVVSTRQGPINGVVCQPSMHLLTQERRRMLVENFSLETAFVDIGVRSEKEARDKGVEILDALTFWPTLSELAGGRWAGPSLGLKAACAAIVSAAAGRGKYARAGETVVIWAAQTKFTARGRGPRTSLGALRARNRWQPQRVIVIDAAAAEARADAPGLGRGPVLWPPKEGPSGLALEVERSAAMGGIAVQHLSGSASPLMTAFDGPGTEVLTLALPVQFIHTPSEIVALKDVQALADLVARFLGAGGGR
jgi:putative aminopeptidase FrvX